MNAKSIVPLLIVSDKISAEALTQPPFSLDPAQFFLTRPASIAYLGFARFARIVLHDPDPTLLRKSQLGLHDGDAEHGLFTLFNAGRPLYILVPAPCQPERAWVDLGLTPVRPAELAELAREGAALPSAEAPRLANQNVLTADDIREMHQQGITRLETGLRLTSWAQEVADSLGMTTMADAEFFTLIDLASLGRKQLKDLGSRLHDAARRSAHVAFVVAPPMIPILRELYPDLGNRIVSPTIHWAKDGAFTGECAARMLADAGCLGAIVPTAAPYRTPDNLKKLAAEASAHHLRLFLLTGLAPVGGCDIMTAPQTAEAEPWRDALTHDWRGRSLPVPTDKAGHRIVDLAAFLAS